jgi:hypothetical protein
MPCPYKLKLDSGVKGTRRCPGGAPPFVIFKGWGFRFDGEYELAIENQNPHPCKKRKDGAPASKQPQSHFKNISTTQKDFQLLQKPPRLLHTRFKPRRQNRYWRRTRHYVYLCHTGTAMPCPYMLTLDGPSRILLQTKKEWPRRIHRGHLNLR